MVQPSYFLAARRERGRVSARRADEVPDTLKLLSFIEKDSRRFPDTSGYGYAQFSYDVKSGTLTPFGNDASFNKEVCYQCHMKVGAQDYIFTSYPPR
jgi:hypothetical protein